MGDKAELDPGRAHEVNFVKKQLTTEAKRLDTDLTIIGLVTFAVFGVFALFGKSWMAYITNSEISVLPRLLLNAALQFGIAGLGISIVMVLRREGFSEFGLVKRNALKAIFYTILCFLPLILCIVASGNFDGYQPLRISITKDVLVAGFPLNILGLALIMVVWGFFEGFNYAVIAQKINKRYPPQNLWLNYGAITCAIICLLFHPIETDLWGILEMITMTLAIYGMLIVKHITGNAWGCVFAFCFIWNAL